MHVHDRCSSLASRFSTYLLSFACTKWELCLYIENLKTKLFQMSPPYLPIYGITLPSYVNLHVPNSKPSNEILFCMLEQLMLQLELPISSMLGRLFLEEWSPLLIYEKGSVTGMPSPMIQKDQSKSK